MKEINYNDEDHCPRCTCKIIISDIQSGELICQQCGMVISEKITDGNPEWRNFQGESNRTRTGSATSLAMYDYGLSTKINPSNKDSIGKTLSISMKQSFKRLRTWDKKSHMNRVSDRNLQEAFTKLGKLRDKLALSDAVIEDAAYTYRKMVEKKLIRGRSIECMIGASLYAACRDSETPRTLQDIVKALNVRRKELAACYRLIIQELDLKMPVADSKQCVSRIASNAGMSEKTKRIAISILKSAEEKGIVAGKNPMGMAASALYLSGISCGENFSQRDIASAALITEVTIRNRIKALKKLAVF